jgi:uncharacterized protein YlaI
MKAQHIPRHCIVCGDEISRIDRNGEKLYESRYKLRTTCCDDCMGRVRKLKRVSYVPLSVIEKFSFVIPQINSN